MSIHENGSMAVCGREIAEMATYSFPAYPATFRVSFECPGCGKPKRQRTLRSEHAINPFNRRPDGQVKTADDVCREAMDEVARLKQEFLAEPLCASCEDALCIAERHKLRARRKRKAGMSVTA